MYDADSNPVFYNYNTTALGFIEITNIGGGENIAPVGIEDAIKHELDQEGYSEISLREPVLNNYV